MNVLKQSLEKVTKRVQKLSFFMFCPTILRFETFTHPKDSYPSCDGLGYYAIIAEG